MNIIDITLPPSRPEAEIIAEDLLASVNSELARRIENHTIAFHKFWDSSVSPDAIAEAMAAADLVSSLGIFQVTIIDSLQASEETGVFGTVRRSISESATASDRVTRRFLWEFIDDSQNVSWQIINTIE